MRNPRNSPRINPRFAGIAASVAFTLLLAAPAQAQMYKCVDARGVPAYSDRPCPGGKGKEVEIQGQPPISGKVTPYREDMKAAERDFQRRQTQQERERQADIRERESQQRLCATKQGELRGASSVRRPANAEAHEARIAKLQAEVASLCR